MFCQPYAHNYRVCWFFGAEAKWCKKGCTFLLSCIDLKYVFFAQFALTRNWTIFLQKEWKSMWEVDKVKKIHAEIAKHAKFVFILQRCYS